VKSVVHISLLLTAAKDFHQLFKNISYFTQEDEEDEEQHHDYSPEDDENIKRDYAVVSESVGTSTAA